MAASFQIIGLASGLDSQALIKSLVELKATPNVKRQAEISSLKAKDNALGSFITKIADLNNSLEKLKSSDLNATKFQTESAASAELVQDFVDKFNTLVKFIANENSLTQVNTSSSSTIVYGSLAKTRIDDDFITQFRSALSSAVADAGSEIKRISELGISTNRDGTLTFAVDKFKSALAQDGGGVFSVLSNFTNSVTGQSGIINNYIKYQGVIGQEQTSANNRINSINKDIERLNRHLESYQEMLVKQFANLENIMGKMQSIGSTLTSYFSSLNKK
ncbi:MAG: flagellar filament capping protein FliD [Deltaproteobacteria bacterium]|jgi:flagellar hook-associated protein 2|nr:flagellar filament capping protein FliD [Deltaproteobacteria bacterium]